MTVQRSGNEPHLSPVQAVTQPVLLLELVLTPEREELFDSVLVQLLQLPLELSSSAHTVSSEKRCPFDSGRTAVVAETKLRRAAGAVFETASEVTLEAPVRLVVERVAVLGRQLTVAPAGPAECCTERLIVQVVFGTVAAVELVAVGTAERTPAAPAGHGLSCCSDLPAVVQCLAPLEL